MSVGWLLEGEMVFGRGMVHDVSQGGLSVGYLGGEPTPGTGESLIVVFRDAGGYQTALGRVITVTREEEVAVLHVTFDPPEQPAVEMLAGRRTT